MKIDLTGRTQARVDDAVREMRDAFPGASTSGIAADLATPEGARAFIAAAPDADILVNNVGTAYIRDYTGIDDIADIPDEDWLGRRRQTNVAGWLGAGISGI